MRNYVTVRLQRIGVTKLKKLIPSILIQIYEHPDVYLLLEIAILRFCAENFQQKGNKNVASNGSITSCDNSKRYFIYIILSMKSGSVP